MGAWGEGVFENDGALDWLNELEGTTDLSVIESAFHAVLRDPGEVEQDDGSQGLAAVEAVVRLVELRAGIDGAESAVDDWVRSVSLEVTPKLLTDAEATARAVMSPGSELVELWEGEIGEPWRASIEALLVRLERVRDSR